MIVFVAHDPGAKNHIRPIYEHALAVGEAAQFVDLASRTDLLDERQASALLLTIRPRGLISGCSMNQSEWPWIRASKTLGIPTAMKIDFGVGRRLEGISQEDFPNRFLVTNNGCGRELTERGAAPDSVKMTGSVHLERVSETKPEESENHVHRLYRLKVGINIVPFFCAADALESAKALVALATFLPTPTLDSFAVIVRPHPRSSSLQEVKSAIRQFKFLHLDARNRVSTSALLLASRFSFSMGSTVSLESLVLGVPSAFLQLGWDYKELNLLYRQVFEVPRIRSADDLQQFVAKAMEAGSKATPGNLENNVGALARAWRVIRDLINSSHSHNK
jgi:hypothetical protein